MSTADPSPTTPTRRQRGRAAAIQEIKAAALDELRRYGAGGVTMRGVARAIDMTPSGLYRYFADHGALLAALGVDAHDSLRAALVRAHEAHPDDDATTAWFRGSLALRRWALDHVDEFAVVVGPPLPGVDPEDRDLREAADRLMEVPIRVVERAIADGELVPTPAVADLSGTASRALGTDDAQPARAIAVGAVAALVGAVSLEAFGRLAPADGEAAFGAYSVQVMRSMGYVRTPDHAGAVRAAS